MHHLYGQIKESLTQLNNNLIETNKTVAIYARIMTFILKKARSRGYLGQEDLRMLEEINTDKLPANPADITADIIREIAATQPS